MKKIITHSYKNIFNKHLLKNFLNISYFVSLVYLSLLLFLLSYLFKFGIDITDEASYLLNSKKSILSSRLYNYDIFFNIHLYISNYNIQIFRITNLILILISNLILLSAFARFLTKVLLQEISLYPLFLLFFLFSFSYYSWLWLPTPSYNSYNLIFCNLFFAMFLFLFERNKLEIIYSKSVVLKLFLLSVVTVLIFFSKSTTGMMLFFFLSFYIYFYSNLKFTNIFLYILGVSFFFLFIIYSYFGNLTYFISNFFDGIKAYSLLEGHNVIIKPFEYLSQLIKAILSLKFFCIILLFSLYLKFKKINLNLNIDSLIFLIFCSIFFDFYKISFVASIFLYNVYFLLVLLIEKNRNLSIMISIYTMSLILALSFSFGTANNILIQSIMIISIILVPLITFFYLRGFSNLFLLLFFISITYGLSNNIFLNIKDPYRVSKPLIENNSKIDLFLKKNKKISFSTDSYTSEFYENINLIFKNNNWNPENYIIDLSGTTPFINLAVPSEAISPWLIGGNKVSKEFALHYLKKLKNSEFKKSAVILSDTDRKISKDILAKAGFKFEESHFLYKSINGPFLFNKNNYEIYLPNKIYEK